MKSLLDILKEKERTAAQRVAIVFRKRKLRYGQLYRQVCSCAAVFRRQLNLSQRDTIGILLKNCPEYIVSYFGALYAEAVVVPLNTFLTAEELTYIINDAKIKILVTSQEFLPTVQKIISFARQPFTVVLTDGRQEGMVSWADVLDGASGESLAYPSLTGTELAVILYTSGTTGYPKGAMLNHKNLLSNVLSCSKAVTIYERDRIILFLPLFHAFTFTVCALVPFYHGARIYMLESVRPFHRIIKSLVFGRITIFVSIPIVYKLLLKTRISSFLFWFLPLRLCVSGGAPLEPEVQANFERKFKIPLLEGYGLSEAAPVVTLNPETEVRRPGSVGIPLPDVEVKIVDEQAREVGVNEIGELIVRGPNVMLGYYNAPELTAETIRAGWLYTGDMARINQDGYIYIVDRKKDMIIVHGMNVYSREVEEVILSHPHITEAAVVGKKDERRGEIPVAFIVVKEKETVSAKEIMQYCRTHLASYKIPRQVRLVAALPKTGTGKISKKALRELL